MGYGAPSGARLVHSLAMAWSGWTFALFCQLGLTQLLFFDQVLQLMLTEMGHAAHTCSIPLPASVAPGPNHFSICTRVRALMSSLM